ncbi:MAG: hypothetical protein Q4D13_06945 [Erysipelotrichaceae bacterium]|nr:hypothetical protein [Erysipelotrichaceae bacterium]
MEIRGIHNRDYELSISVWGEGSLNNHDDKEKINDVIKEYTDRYDEYPERISLIIEDSINTGYEYGVDTIEKGVLEDIKNLKEIIVPSSVVNIKCDPEGLKDVLIRGEYGSHIWGYAYDNNLRFLHSDLLIAYVADTRHYEVTSIYLVFREDGSIELYRKELSPGLEAGTGTEYTYDDTDYVLDNKFFKKYNAEDIASWYNEDIEKDILDRGVLEDFIRKARNREMVIS